MSEIERFDVLVFGSGAGGKLTAWVSAKVADFVRHDRDFGSGTAPASVDIAEVRLSRTSLAFAPPNRLRT